MGKEKPFTQNELARMQELTLSTKLLGKMPGPLLKKHRKNYRMALRQLGDAVPKYKEMPDGKHFVRSFPAGAELPAPGNLREELAHKLLLLYREKRRRYSVKKWSTISAAS